jgi:alkaline phosphatase
MTRTARVVGLVLALVAGAALLLPRLASEESRADEVASDVGSVIFFHPDGMGVNTWGAVRMMTVGPDGRPPVPCALPRPYERGFAGMRGGGVRTWQR